MHNCVNAVSRMTGSGTPQSRIRTLRRRPLSGNHGSVRICAWHGFCGTDPCKNAIAMRSASEDDQADAKCGNF